MSAEMNITMMTELAEQGFIPDGGEGLGKVLEAFPELFRTLITAFDGFSVWAGGTGFTQVSDGLTELARDCGQAAEAAEQLAMNPQAQFLRNGT